MRFLVALAVAFAAGTAAAQPSLKMMIPANPGGGWDQTGRNLAAAMQSAKLVSGRAVRQQGRRRRHHRPRAVRQLRRRATRTP